MNSEFRQIAIDKLHSGQYQPRQNFNQQALVELADSIRSQGLIEPLIVRELAQGHYEIIAGERRWRAAQLANLTTVPCLVGQYSDQQACALTLIENIQRQDLNLIEEASGYKRLIEEFHYQQDEIAILVGKSRSHIANLLRLLNLHPRVKEAIAEEQLGLGHARLLVSLEPELQALLCEEILLNQWSVRQLEQQIKIKKDRPLPANPGPQDRDTARLERILSEQLGAPVQISSENNQGGWLQVKFFNNETLAGLLERLGLSYD